MSALKKGYYQADRQNGVTFVDDILEDENQEVLPALLFAESLWGVAEDEVIVSFFDSSKFSILKHIEEEYGLH